MEGKGEEEFGGIKLEENIEKFFNFFRSVFVDNDKLTLIINVFLILKVL